MPNSLNRPNLSPLFYAHFSLFHFHGGYQECPPPARLINNCIQCPCRSPSRLPCKHGRLKATLELWWAYPYSAPAHSWPPPSSRAVCSAIKSLDCRVSSPVFTMQIRSTESTTAMLPSPLSSGATQGVHSATVCRSFRTQRICPLCTSRRVCREQISRS